MSTSRLLDRHPFLGVLIIGYLSVLLAVILEVVFLNPSGIVAALEDWQPLIASAGALMAAIGAAVVAYRNTAQTLEQNRTLKQQERSRKHAAVRAVFPLALTEISEYAKQSAQALGAVLKAEALKATIRNPPAADPSPPSVSKDFIKPLPTGKLDILTELIEYSDPPLDVGLLHWVITRIQIHNARLNEFVSPHPNEQDKLLIHVTPNSIETGIIDAASIRAGSDAMFEYARGLSDQLPTTVTWQQVETALFLMKISDVPHPSLDRLLERHKQTSSGPLEHQHQSHHAMRSFMANYP